MKIALINENSQAAKNGIIEAALKKVVEPMGHEVVNYGMYAADDAAQLTYVQCGILAAILHTKAPSFSAPFRSLPAQCLLLREYAGAFLFRISCARTAARIFYFVFFYKRA